jgi:uncharacterized protein YegL
MTGVPLILRREPVHRTDPSMWRPAVASVAVVYADASGTLVRPDRPPRMRDSWRWPYRIRYEVDVSDHERSFSAQTTPLAAKGDVYAFQSVVNVGFRVTDPVTVVRRNVVDALLVVYPRLIHMMRMVTREFNIYDSAAAERRINELFSEPVTLDEGITVYRCMAHLSPDPSVQRHVIDKDSADRSADVNRHLHAGNRDATEHELELESLRHRAEMARRESEIRALGNDSLDYQRVLQLHLIQHPEDTERVLNLLVAYEQSQDEKRVELFQFMIEKDLVNGVDVEVFRKEMLGGIRRQDATAKPRHTLPRSETWIDEPTSTSTPSSTSTPTPTPTLTPTGAASGEVPVRDVPPPPMSARDVSSRGPDGWDTAGWDTVGGGLLPMYVVVEESVTVRPWLSDLEEGVAALCRALADNPTIAARVRLTVLGFADEVTTYLSRADVRQLPGMPQFSVRGEARYTATFTDLIGRVQGDVDALEADGHEVHRPTVVFVTAGRPADGDAWRSTHRRLVDRGTLRRAPNIVACGIGGMSARTVNAVASRAELAFVCDDVDVRLSIHRFFDALVRSVVQSRGTLASEPVEFVVPRPVGFHLASEVI